MTGPANLAEHIRLAMLDAAMDRGIPSVRRERFEYVLTYPDGKESRWSATAIGLPGVATSYLLRAYELATILAFIEEESE